MTGMDTTCRVHTKCAEFAMSHGLEPILTLINQRFQARTTESLVEFVEEMPVHPDNLAAQAHWVFSHKATVVALLEQPEHLRALIEHSLQQVKDYLYRRNQYLDLPHPARQNLRIRYAKYYASIRELLRSSTQLDEFARQIEEITTLHLAQLATGLQQEIASHSASYADYRAYLETVACAEYSPQQQLTMLGVSVEEIQPPVLDLGCGTQAALCRYLHECGIAVLGIDRLAPDLPFCRRSGWDEFVYEAMTWGAIISHHAFSTHFHFHHRHSEQKATDMAALLMKILNSLKPGGAFIYTPGLPFIEPFIAENGHFDLTTVAIPDAPLNLQSIAYACHLQRNG